MHYYQHNIGDYARDTSHLTVVEHGIYRLLLDWCYLNEKPITTEKAMRLARGYPTETQSVLSEFFVGSEDGWTHPRVTAEIEKFRLKAEKNRSNGGKGGRPKTKNNPVGSQTVSEQNPTVTLTNNQEPKNQRTKDQDLDSSLRSESCGQPSAEPRLTVGSDADDGPGACPQQAIIAEYHRQLPELPPVLEWSAANAKALRQRWRSSPDRSSLDWWRDWFAYVKESDFLMGRRTSFQASLGWLVKAENFAKVINGQYENRGSERGAA